MKLIKFIIGWFYNDWETIEVLRGTWSAINSDYVLDYTVYEIQFSQFRKKYRLNCTGTEFKKHPKYVVAVEKLNKYKNDLLSTTNTGN